MSNPVSTTRYGLARLRKRQEIADRYGIDIDNIIDVSGGDNLFTPPQLIQQIITKEIQNIDPRDSYPVDYVSFIDEISRFTGVDGKFVYPGFSHNLLVQRLVSTFTKPKDTILLFSPEKDIYTKIAHNQQLKVKNLDLGADYQLDIDAIFEEIDNVKPKTIMFSSPHYPTGNQFEEQDIIALAKETSIPIIIDESYVEFGKYSLVNQVEYYDNLNIVRSFSKAWGLGAFSCAYLISDPLIINQLKDHYLVEEIPPIHLLATTYILQNPYRFVELIQNFLQERKRVFEHLRLLSDIRAYRTDTNFIYIETKQPINEIYEHLCSKGIIVQNFESSPYFEKKNSLLVTLATKSINEQFILSLIEVLETLI